MKKPSDSNGNSNPPPLKDRPLPPRRSPEEDRLAFEEVLREEAEKNARRREKEGPPVMMVWPVD